MIPPATLDALDRLAEKCSEYGEHEYADSERWRKFRTTITPALVRELVAAAEELARAEIRIDRLENALSEHAERVRVLEGALRNAPMPMRESTLHDGDWDEFYDAWWHAHASEAALAGRE